MSETPDNDLSLDLQFLPDWAQDEAGKNKYADHSGEDRPTRGGGRKGPRRNRGERGDRGRDDRRPRGDRSQGKGGRDQRGRRDDDRRGARDKRGRDNRGGKFKRPQAPQLDIKVDFVPDVSGVESIAKEIKLTGRSYPLFQIALLVLERPARYTLRLRVQKKPGGEVGQRLFACKLDGSPWLNEDQAVRHTLESHFDEFYETRKTETEGPKGNFTFVAQCGVTDEYLGAPNHHDYQNRLVTFHAERLSRMPFEKFKSRIRIVKEEEAINAWLEQAKWKTEYVTRKSEEEAIFTKRDAVEAHFRAQHLAEAVEEVAVCEISGENAKAMQNPRTLAEFLKDQWHKQKHFPMQLSTHLSKQFSKLGLQFFKKDKKVTHVSVARPNFLDVETEPVSEGVKKIMQFIDATEECTRRQILENLGDLEHVEPVEPKEGEDPAPAPEQTEEQKQLISDLHWLIHQGHVLEFSNGIIETAKKPRKTLEQEQQSEVSPAAQSNEESEVKSEELVEEQDSANEPTKDSAAESVSDDEIEEADANTPGS